MLRVFHGVSALLVFAFAFVPGAFAQAHFQACYSMTGGNASVIVSTTINPTFNGEPLEAGDEIAVFTPEGECAGTSTWSGSNMSITVWGDDSITPEKDGFAVGDAIAYKVWDASEGVESDDVDVSYSSDQPFYRTDGTYAENAIYVLSSLAATIALPEPGVPALASPADGATEVSLSPTLTWGASSDAATYDVQVSTSSDFSSLFDSETGITSTDHALAGLSEATVYFWRVRAVNESGASAYSAAWSFTTSEPEDPEPPSASEPGVPALSSPDHEATDVSATPTLTWEAAADAASYDVEVSATQDFSDPLESKTGLTSTSHALSGLAEGTMYHWRVRAVNESGASAYSAAWSFTTTEPDPDPGSPAGAAPNTPTLASPADAVTEVTLTPTLTWEADSVATSYTLEVSTTDNFLSLVAGETDLTETSHTLGELTEGTTYFWRLQAANESGESPFTDAWTFTTTAPEPLPLPAVPVLSAPSEDAADVSSSPTLAWKAPDDAESYELQVSTEADFSSLSVSKTGLAKTSYVISDLTKGITYYWRVRAVNETGAGAFSGSWSFTTAAHTNSAPGVANAISDQKLAPGDAPYTLDLAGDPPVFSDADGDAMSYSAGSDDTSVAVASVDGTVLEVSARDTGSAVITITATDEHGLAATLGFTVTVQVEGPNTAPVFKSSPVRNTVTDVRYSYRVSASDKDGDPLTLTATVIPTWLSLDDNGDGTGVLAGTPAKAHIGVHEITLTVTDDRGGSARQTYYLSVSKKNNPPEVVFTETAISHSLEDGNFTIDLTEVFEDADGDPLSFAAKSNNPEVAAVEVHDDVLIVTPLQRGTATITLTATNARHLVTKADLTFTVEYNNAPVAVRDYVAVQEDTETEIDVLANDTDPDDDTLEIEILTMPSYGTAVVRNDRIVYTPSARYYGPDSLVYGISDEFGGTASEYVIIEVKPSEDAPVFPTIDPISSPEDGAHLVIGGETPDDAVSADLGISVVWNSAVGPEGAPVEYVWELAGTEDFSETLLRVLVGADTSIYMTYGEISDALAGQGVEVGASITGYHRVVAEAGETSRMSVARSITLTRGTITTVDEKDLPASFSLDQNYPNPFNPRTTISYSLETTALVTLKVYDVLGKEVATLIAQEMPPGNHSVRFDADMLNSGTYFYRLNAESHMATKQMILLK